MARCDSTRQASAWMRAGEMRSWPSATMRRSTSRAASPAGSRAMPARWNDSSSRRRSHGSAAGEMAGTPASATRIRHSRLDAARLKSLYSSATAPCFCSRSSFMTPVRTSALAGNLQPSATIGRTATTSSAMLGAQYRWAVSGAMTASDAHAARDIEAASFAESNETTRPWCFLIASGLLLTAGFRG